MNVSMLRFSIFFLLLFTLLVSCQKSTFSSKWTSKEAPEEFKARFETTKGSFDIVARREWSEEGVDRLYQLIRYGHFDDTPIYRVIDDFVAQFGHLDTVNTYQWDKFKLQDESVIEKNLEGTIAFARAGKQTRGTQLFINLSSNSPRLDEINSNGVVGFPVIAKVTAGMENVKKFKSYDDRPRRALSSQANANAFLKENFPDMDFIVRAYLLKK